MGAAGRHLPRAAEPDLSGPGLKAERTTVTIINPPTVWTVPEPFRTIYTHARAAQPGRTLFVSGQFGVAPDGRMHEGFADQLARAMDNVEATLAAAGMRLPDVAKATFFLTRAGDLPMLGQVRRARWASEAPAAVTVLVVAGLARPDALVEVEVTAVAADPDGHVPDRLRSATKEDVPRIEALVQTAYATWVPIIGREPTPMTADYALAVRTNRFDLLERDGALVALVETIPRADHLWIENLAVSPACHGQGLGRRMLRHAEDMARALGHMTVRLGTNQAFAGNVDFYRRAGFVVEREEPFRGGVGIYLSKTL
ncbi:GNAT family N-acetyltransferase [Methylobacterium currus]|uniref:GNAT family N-acetyltransferase n=1 Tax=Methylobacterium currus TaxID=2051553 RepID=A0A2R4WEI2_9HYPH|nr:GNAT family N-acetyltransferase [Methylobacterium currus]AWB19932.1 GNAT family N-acetyltransferase [Methylobacterium currus]